MGKTPLEIMESELEKAVHHGFKRTFYNPPSTNADDFVRDADKAVQSFEQELVLYAEYGWDLDDIDELEDHTDIDEVRDLLALLEKVGDSSPIHERFLSFEPVYHDCEAFDPPPVQYYRVLISYGGPSTEVRFHPCGLIEFVYLDWWCGTGFDVSKSRYFQNLREYFQECGSFTWGVSTNV